MSTATSNKNEDDDGVTTIPEGPVIVSLYEKPLRIRPVAMFDTLAKDFSADCKHKFDQMMGKKSHAMQKRSASYRKARQEFLCFTCCYGLVGIATACFGISLVLDAITNNDKFDLHANRDITDDVYSVRKATSFLEMIKFLLYRDDGF